MSFYVKFAYDFIPDIEKIVINNAPEFMRGVRALFVSDIHIRRRSSDSYIGSLIEIIEKVAPDLLLFGGDFAECTSAAQRFFERLAQIKARLGIFAVPGNNDAECFGDIEAIRENFPGRMLVNESVALPIGDGVLRIGGVDEAKLGNPDARGLFPDDGSQTYGILISHYPSVPDTGPGRKPQLMLSGHTHAGQINLWGFTVYSLGYERKMVALAEGTGYIDGIKTIVSPGIGVSRLPVRIGARPAVQSIEFH